VEEPSWVPKREAAIRERKLLPAEGLALIIHELHFDSIALQVYKIMPNIRCRLGFAHTFQHECNADV
jgi:hypothetical protein